MRMTGPGRVWGPEECVAVERKNSVGHDDFLTAEIRRIDVFQVPQMIGFTKY